jgi:hypothetical protein
MSEFEKEVLKRWDGLLAALGALMLVATIVFSIGIYALRMDLVRTISLISR